MNVEKDVSSVEHISSGSDIGDIGSERLMPEVDLMNPSPGICDARLKIPSKWSTKWISERALRCGTFAGRSFVASRQLDHGAFAGRPVDKASLCGFRL